MNYNKYRDYDRIKFVANAVQEKWPEIFVRYEIPEEEDYDHGDCTILTTSGTEYKIEVKTVSFEDSSVNPENNNCINAAKWKTNSQYILAPMSGETWSGITKEWVQEANTTISGIHGTNTYSYIEESTDKYYFINAASQWADATDTKGYKLINDKRGCLAFLGRDGILIFSHRTLSEAHRVSGCMWRYQSHFKEDGEEMKAKGKSEKSWELKALINLKYGTFIPCEVPKSLFSNDKK